MKSEDSSPEPPCLLSLLSPDRAIMGTTALGPIHLLELCDQKLIEFVCNVDNKDMVWLEEIEEEAERMFTRCGQGRAGGTHQGLPKAPAGASSPPDRQDRQAASDPS